MWHLVRIGIFIDVCFPSEDGFKNVYLQSYFAFYPATWVELNNELRCLNVADLDAK